MIIWPEVGSAQGRASDIEIASDMTVSLPLKSEVLLMAPARRYSGQCATGLLACLDRGPGAGQHTVIARGMWLGNEHLQLDILRGINARVVRNVFVYEFCPSGVRVAEIHVVGDVGGNFWFE